MADQTDPVPLLPSPARGHMPELDGVRGLAIGLVLMVHSYNRGPDVAPEAIPGGTFVDMLIRFGWSGVELFFVLSGLLVTSLLLERKRRRLGLGAFYARRLARIVPAYLAVVCAVALLGFVSIHPLVDPVSRQAQNLFPGYALFLSNWFAWYGIEASQAGKALGPLWSVATEMQYYLLWPLLVMTLSEARLKLVLPLFLALTVAARLAALAGEVDAGAIYVASLTHLDGIILGSLLALYWDGLATFARRRAAGACALAGLALVGLFAVSGTTNELDPMVQQVGYTLIAVFYVLLLLVAVAGGRLTRFLRLALLRKLGAYSYVIYLVHWPVLLVMDQFVPGQGLVAWLIYFIAFTGGMMLFGALSWALFEGPIIRWNRRREQLVSRGGQVRVPAA